jgi:hypothetical protein
VADYSSGEAAENLMRPKLAAALAFVLIHLIYDTALEIAKAELGRVERCGVEGSRGNAHRQ